MRLVLAAEKASGLSGASVEHLSNAIFFDYFEEAAPGVVKLRRSEETLHFFDKASSEVLEFSFVHDHNSGSEDVAKHSYVLPPANGFATRPIGPYGELIDHATVVEQANQAAASFLKDRRTHLRIDALVSMPIAGKWPADASPPAGLFIVDSIKALQQPVWISARIAPKTGACFIMIVDAHKGTLLAETTIRLAFALIVLFQPGVLIPGIGAYLLKFLLLLLIIAGVWIAAPEIGVGAALGAIWAGATGASVAAGWAFIGAVLGAIGGFIALLRDFFCEVSANATDAWKQKRDAVQARIDAAQARATAGQAAQNGAEARGGLQDERQALKDMRDLLDDPDSGIEKELSQTMQQAIDQAVAGIDAALNH